MIQVATSRCNNANAGTSYDIMTMDAFVLLVIHDKKMKTVIFTRTKDAVIYKLIVFTNLLVPFAIKTHPTCSE